MRTFSLLLASLLTLGLSAQAPPLMSYQAVVRDGSNTLVANAPVGMRISIRQGTATGTAVYVETHDPTTNANGLATLQVGAGAVVSGSVAAIDWAVGPYFLQAETDPAGGTNYSISGTQQLLSVPYALYAANGGTQGPQGPPGEQGPPGPGACDVIHTGDGRVVIYSATEAKGFGFNSTSGSGWYNTTLNGTVLGAVASDSCVVIYTTTNAYGFGFNSTSGSSWYNITVNAPPTTAVVSSGRIVIYSNTEAKGFGFNSTSGSSWYSTTFNAAPVGHVAGGDRIVVYSNTEAKGFGFNETSGSSWSSTTLNNPPVDHIGTH